ncbi:MAG TPA: HAD family phosphatase [Tepidisphaeraceae bacterium]|jgi:HAD superfamily hydrolase (TIGR01509 family)|nr:HAD family phosphatase [Tepidisphaeraceae bacterium]
MANWPAAVLFDFDGVLVNSEPLHFQAFREVLAAEHIKLTEEEYYRELIGFDDKGAFRHVYEMRKRELPAKTFLALMAAKGRMMKQLIHRGQFSALPGVEEFVRALWRNRLLAICSGALREEIEAMLQGISLRDCFSAIVGAEDVPVGKPDPRGYLLTTQLLSEKIGKPIAPADCLIIEDAPTVIASVKKAGFPVLAVTTSYSADKLKEADWVVSSLKLEEVAAAVPKLAASWKET